MRREEQPSPFEVVIEVTPDDTLVATIDSSLDGETDWEVFEDEIDLLFESVGRVRRAMKSLRRTGRVADLRTRPSTETQPPDDEHVLALGDVPLQLASALQPQQPTELFLPSPSDDEEDSLAAESG